MARASPRWAKSSTSASRPASSRSPAPGSLMTASGSGRAERVSSFMFFRFAWGELPSPEKLAFYLAGRSDLHGGGEHWSDGTDKRLRGDRRSFSFAEFCELYDEIELWFDPTPTDQLQL